MRHALRFALLAFSSLSILPAHAQQEEIVITATRTPTPAHALPADITVLDAEAARAHGRTTLADAIAGTPGLGVVPSGGAGQQTSVFSGGANSNHTLVLFDGLRLNDPSTPGSSFDAGQDQIGALARIEIVEGPMSAVFGSDALGGAINLIPRHGGAAPLTARLDLAAGAFGTLTGMAGVDGTLGRFRYALSAEAFATEGHDLVPERMSTHTGDEDGAEMNALTAVLDLDLYPSVTLDLLARRREARADFDPFQFDASFNEFRADDSDLEIATNDVSLARLGATWDVNDTVTLRATTGGLEQVREQVDDGAVTDGFEGRRRFAELTLSWRGNELHGFDDVAVVAGFAGEREKVDIAQGFGFSPPSLFTVAAQDQYGAFVTAQGRHGRVNITGAVRVDDYEGFGANTTWRVGSGFELSDAARVFAAYGTSFRAPTLYERFVSFGNPDLEPERGESWEAGIESRFTALGQANGLELGALYRRTNIEDLIDFGPLFTYANVERAEIDTGEARVGVALASWLTLRAGYVYTDARDVLAGVQLLRRPEQAWTAGVDIDRGPFSARFTWRSIGERRDFLYGDDGVSLGEGVAAGYQVARLSAAYAFMPGMEAYIAVENAFDEVYEPVSAFVGAPRGAMAGIRLRSGE